MREHQNTALFTAESYEQLQERLSALNTDVPRRSEGRKTEHAEIHTIARLLSALPGDYWDFPMTLVHRDRPDFMVQMGSRTVGIEVMEAVPPEVAWKDALREQGHGTSPHFVQRASVDDERKTATEVRAELAAEHKPENWGAPDEGDAVEDGWGVVMARKAAEKVAISAKEGFEAASENWLLLYDNWPPGVDDARKAAAAFLRQPEVPGVLNRFERVFVVDGARTWEFTQNGSFHGRRITRC